MTDRRDALFACGAAGLTAALSGLVTVSRWRHQAGRAVLHVPAEGRLVVTLGPGLTTTVQISDRIFGGGFSLTETRFEPGARTPLHLHERSDITLVIQEGVLDLAVEDRRLRAAGGSTVFVPRGARFAVLNASDQPSRCLALHSPGGIEALLSALAIQAGGDRSALARRHGVEILGPVPSS